MQGESGSRENWARFLHPRCGSAACAPMALLTHSSSTEAPSGLAIARSTATIRAGCSQMSHHHLRSLEPSMLSQFRKILRHTVLAGLVGLGLCGTGHAALVVGVFDPDFGGPLAGTNYSGSATFSISQSCLDLNLPSIGLFIPAFLPCGSGGSGMEFLGAHVNSHRPSRTELSTSPPAPVTSWACTSRTIRSSACGRR